MKKIATLLLLGASMLLSSCEYDSVGVSYTSSSYYTRARPVYIEPHSTTVYRYHTPIRKVYSGYYTRAGNPIYNYSGTIPPDYIRYGCRHKAPASYSRHHRHH